MIYEIDKGTGVFCSEGAGCRVYFIARPEPMLIDTGAPGRGENILRDLASIGVQPIQVRKIILTHHHIGHSGGLWLLKRRTGAHALAHQADAPYLTGRRSRRAARRSVERVFQNAIAKVGFGDAMIVSLERTLEEGDEINGWRVIHTPGQTPGHICLHRRDILISGDLLSASAGGFRVAPPPTIIDPTAYLRSLRMVAKLDFEIILPGHNPPYVVDAAKKVRELVASLE
ncbi:MAG: hydrolase [Chloroflexota bacterium]|nr:MAG: hydrolase [Chloroflexota bacterium]